MKRRHYVLLALLVLAGIVGGFYLIPSTQELALMSFRDKDLESAKKNFEALVETVGLSPSVVNPLAELYIESGQVDKAADLMERFVRANPENPSARKGAVRYYRFAQLPLQSLIHLEILNRLEVTEENQRELAMGYRQLARQEQLTGALQKLVSNFNATPQEYLELAKLHALQGQLGKAADVLQRLQNNSANTFDAEHLHFLFRVFVDTNQFQEAFRASSMWLAKHPNSGMAEQLAVVLQNKGQLELACKLVEPYEAQLAERPESLSFITQLQIASGRRDAVYPRLQKLYSAKQLPPELLPSFIDLMLDRSETEPALVAAQAGDLKKLPAWLLARLAQAALEVRKTDLAQKIFHGVSQEFLGHRPLLAAELTLALGNSTGAKHWLSKVNESSLNREEKISLAGLYSQTGRLADAHRLFSQLQVQGPLPDRFIPILAHAYLQGGKAQEGLKLFENLRQSQPSAQVETGWALLALAAGSSTAIFEWLERISDNQLESRALLDLYYAASNQHHKPLALALAERLYRRQPGRKERFILASALAAVGRPMDAVEHLRALQPGNSEENAAYLRALVAAMTQGNPVEDELRRVTAQQLARPGLTESQKRELLQVAVDLKDYQTALPSLPEMARTNGDTWLFALLEAAQKTGRKSELIEFLKSDLRRPDLSESARELRIRALLENGGEEAALPYLRHFAAQRRGQWWSAYENALNHLGRSEELAEFWRSQAVRSDLTAQERRSLAYRLLDLGDRYVAEILFLELARRAPPNSPDVMQLLYIWGPRPGTPALDWLEARARESSGKDRAAWMKHLLNAGGAKRVINLAASEPPAGPSH